MGWNGRGVLRTKGQGGVEVRKSVSHHHRHSAWQRGVMAGVWRYIDDGDRLGDGDIWQYRGNPEGRSDGK